MELKKSRNVFVPFASAEIPANTQCNDNVLWGQNDVVPSLRPDNDIIVASFVGWDVE